LLWIVFLSLLYSTLRHSHLCHCSRSSWHVPAGGVECVNIGLYVCIHSLCYITMKGVGRRTLVKHIVATVSVSYEALTSRNTNFHNSVLFRQVCLLNIYGRKMQMVLFFNT
jgi:hypothetical protein